MSATDPGCPNVTFVGNATGPFMPTLDKATRERDEAIAERDAAREALIGLVDLYRHPDSGRLIVEAGSSALDDALIAANAVLTEGQET